MGKRGRDTSGHILLRPSFDRLPQHIRDLLQAAQVTNHNLSVNVCVWLARLHIADYPVLHVREDKCSSD